MTDRLAGLKTESVALNNGEVVSTGDAVIVRGDVTVRGTFRWAETGRYLDAETIIPATVCRIRMDDGGHALYAPAHAINRARPFVNVVVRFRVYPEEFHSYGGTTDGDRIAFARDFVLDELASNLGELSVVFEHATFEGPGV